MFKLKAPPRTTINAPNPRASSRDALDKRRHLAAQVPLDSPALMARCKAGMISQQVLKMIEAETQSRPTSARIIAVDPNCYPGVMQECAQRVLNRQS